MKYSEFELQTQLLLLQERITSEHCTRRWRQRINRSWVCSIPISLSRLGRTCQLAQHLMNLMKRNIKSTQKIWKRKQRKGNLKECRILKANLLSASKKRVRSHNSARVVSTVNSKLLTPWLERDKKQVTCRKHLYKLDHPRKFCTLEISKLKFQQVKASLSKLLIRFGCLRATFWGSEKWWKPMKSR